MEHLNRYDVIHLDIQWFLATVDSVDEVIKLYYGQRACRIAGELSGCFAGRGKYSTGCAFAAQGKKNGQKFVVIIDEWDVLIRDESANGKVQKAYINF